MRSKAVGIEKKQTVMDQLLDESCPKLSYNQRLTGYVLCMSIGFFSRSALIRLKELPMATRSLFYFHSIMCDSRASSCRDRRALQENDRSLRRIATAFYPSRSSSPSSWFYEKIPDDGRVGLLLVRVYSMDSDALVHDLVHPLRAGLGLHVLLPGAARLLQEARY